MLEEHSTCQCDGPPPPCAAEFEGPPLRLQRAFVSGHQEEEALLRDLPGALERRHRQEAAILDRAKLNFEQGQVEFAHWQAVARALGEIRGVVLLIG
jgi:hypothetical protein